MDEFLKDIYTTVFKQWILTHDQEGCHIYQDLQHEDVIVIETDCSHSEVTFNPMNIIELSVTNTLNQQIEFYLHFQMNTLKHALELFHEMMMTIQTLVHKPPLKILLSCTGGLTTGFFAEKLNEATELLSLDYEFSAVPYQRLFEIGYQYDVILLAPQISYMQAKVQAILKDKCVLKIPSTYFAQYDVAKTMRFIEDALSHVQATDSPVRELPSLKKPFHHQGLILVIVMIKTNQKVYIAYRVYDENNQSLLYREVVKSKLSLDDISDILDTVFVRFPQIVMVGLSMPGIINNGRLTLVQSEFHDCDVVDYFTQKYHHRFVLCNDVNCVAVGYYVSQEKYESLSFVFQPKAAGAGGVGSIYKGELINGRLNIAGEVQYLPMNLSADRYMLSKTPEGAVELVGQTVASIISILGPEAIVVFCQLISQADELQKEVEKYLPTQYIPPLIVLDDLKEYNLLGQLVLCIQSLSQKAV